MPATGLSVYGKTKREGELKIVETLSSAVIIRTAWLYSEFGNNFVKTMIKLGKEREALNVVFDQVGTPTYALDLAKAMITVARKCSQTVTSTEAYTTLQMRAYAHGMTSHSKFMSSQALPPAK